MSEKFTQPKAPKENSEAHESQEINPNELRKKLDRTLHLGTLTELEALFDEGMDVDQEDFEGRTAIMMLAAKGSKAGVEMMISRNANVNHVYMYHDRIPFTALDAARETNRKEIEELLLAHGAKTGKEIKAESDS